MELPDQSWHWPMELPDQSWYWPMEPQDQTWHWPMELQDQTWHWPAQAPNPVNWSMATACHGAVWYWKTLSVCLFVCLYKSTCVSWCCLTLKSSVLPGMILDKLSFRHVAVLCHSSVKEHCGHSSVKEHSWEWYLRVREPRAWGCTQKMSDTQNARPVLPNKPWNRSMKPTVRLRNTCCMCTE